MKLCLLCLIFSLSLIRSSEIADACIQEKIDYIDAVLASMEAFKNLKIELDAELYKVWISNTAGNIASVAGVALLFTPFFAAGLTAVGLGTATSIGSNVYEKFIIQDRFMKLVAEVL